MNRYFHTVGIFVFEEDHNAWHNNPFRKIYKVKFFIVQFHPFYTMGNRLGFLFKYSQLLSYNEKRNYD
jgi:hypothetical protein